MNETKIIADADEYIYEDIFKSIVESLGFNEWELSAGSDGYQVCCRNSKARFSAALFICRRKDIVCKTQHSDIGISLETLKAKCSFESLYKTLVNMLVDIKNKCWRLNLTAMSMFSRLSEDSIENNLEVLTKAGEHVRDELAIKLDLIA